MRSIKKDSLAPSRRLGYFPACLSGPDRRRTVTEGTMHFFRNLYSLRHKIVRFGTPALVSRGTMAVWGIVHIFIIRAIPEDAFSAYALARTMETFGLLLGGGFIQQAILKMVSEGDTRREHELANAGILLTLVFAVLSAGALLATGGLARGFYSGVDLAGLAPLLAGVVVSAALAGIPRALLLSVRRIRDVMYVDLLQFMIRGVIIGFLILNGSLRTGHQIFAATIAANMLSLVLSFLLAGRFFFVGTAVSAAAFRKVLSFSVVCLGTAAANYIYTSTDIMMLGKIAPQDVGAYGAVRSLTGVFAMVNAAGNMVLLPLLSQMWKQGRRDMIVSRTWSSVLVAELILFPAVVALVLFPSQILGIVFSGKYVDGWPITVVLGALMLVRPLGSFFSTAALAIGKPLYSLYSVLVSSLLNVVLNLLLIRDYGGFGAAVATAVAVVLGTVWVIRITCRYVGRVESGQAVTTP